MLMHIDLDAKAIASELSGMMLLTASMDLGASWRYRQVFIKLDCLNGVLPK
jgi:hypothetical protein